MSFVITASTLSASTALGALGAGTALYGAYNAATSKGPQAPANRSFGNEVTDAGNQYQNLLQMLTGGAGFTGGGLNNLNQLTQGNPTFNASAALQAMTPEDRANIDAAAADTGRSAVQWLTDHVNAQAANGDQSAKTLISQYGGYGQGLPQISSNLNTQNRTSNLNDVQNLSQQYQDVTRQANPDFYNQLSSFTNAANAPIQQGASQQQAANLASQGFGTFDPSGLQARTNFTSRNVNSQNVNAAQGNPVLDALNKYAVGNLGPSGLQQQQNSIAQQLLSDGGNLSESDLRNVQQSSRAGFNSRGLGATNASVVDEVLNTDAAKRARLTQNLGLAQGVQNQGLAESGQQQQFGLGVSGQNLNYGQLGLQAQTSNQSANLQSQLANQSANLQAQQLGLQGQVANQNLGLNSFNSNLNSQALQQQALRQSAALQEQQRQSQFAQQQAAFQAQLQGRLDPYSAILGGTQDTLGAALNLNGQSNSQQSSLLNALLGYGSDTAGTNYNANAAANIAGYNGQQALNGSLIGLGGNLLGSYIGSQGGTGGKKADVMPSTYNGNNLF